MEIADAAKTVEGPPMEDRKGELQAVLDSAFAGDAQRKALGEAALRAIDKGLEVLRTFGVELEAKLVKAEAPKAVAKPVVGRK